MFDMDMKKKDLKENLLEKLIDTLMAAPDKGEDKEEESCEMPELAEAMGDEKPKAKVEVMELEVKPKAKYKLADGSEHDDETLEDILKRKKLEA